MDQPYRHSRGTEGGQVTNFKLLDIELQMQGLITERCGMLALNEWRASRGESQAYSDEAFQELSIKFEALRNALRD